MSGRIINGSEEVVKVKYAEELLIKMGYKVIRPQIIYLVYTLTGLFVVLGAILIQ